jgi:hypothetical protein
MLFFIIKKKLSTKECNTYMYSTARSGEGGWKDGEEKANPNPNSRWNLNFGQISTEG